MTDTAAKRATAPEMKGMPKRRHEPSSFDVSPSPTPVVVFVVVGAAALQAL